MAKILAIGTGPLFTPDVKVFNGQALRTWHLTRPLRDAGHRVDLIVLPVADPGRNPDPDNVLARETCRGFNYEIVQTKDDHAILRAFQQKLDQGQYDCILAVNNNAAAIACRLATRLPFWIDLNGYIMGEGQTKCKVYEDDSFLKHFWDIERIALRRGDRFSAVSHKQMYAVLGELGALGRLNRYTLTHPFLTVTPNAAYEEFLDPASYPASPSYRGKTFPDDAVALLWSGGFNTWTDVPTIVGAVSMAMEQDPRIHLVTTGGTIYGHDEVTYDLFCEQLERAGFLDRCHLLGWVEAGELFALYKECDLGISIDSLNYETLFGARNRLTNMMAAGLPILTTVGTEITEIIQESKLGYTVSIGDVQGLADAMVRAARSPVERRQLSKRAKRYCTTHFSYEATTRALVRWAEAPQLAPDNAEKIRRWPDETNLTACAISSLEEEVIRTETGNTEELLRAHEEFEALKRKPIYKVYRKITS